MKKQNYFPFIKYNRPDKKNIKPKWSFTTKHDLKRIRDDDFTPNDEVFLNDEPLLRPEANGVTIIPNYDKIPENYPVDYEYWKVISGELENKNILILRDITKKLKKGRVVSRGKFETIYFTEAL